MDKKPIKNEIPEIGVSKLESVTEKLLRAGDNVIIYSQPGFGKSEILTALAERLKETGIFDKIVPVQTASCEAADFNGLPSFSEKNDRKILEFFKLEKFNFNPDEKILFIFDEYNRGALDVLNATLTLFNSGNARQLGFHKIENPVQIICLVNPESSYGVNSMPEAVLSRAAQIYVIPELPFYIKYFESRYPNNMFVRYLKSEHNIIDLNDNNDNPDDNTDGVVKINARSIEKAIQKVQILGHNDPDILTVIAANVGKQVALSFLEFTEKTRVINEMNFLNEKKDKDFLDVLKNFNVDNNAALIESGLKAIPKLNKENSDIMLSTLSDIKKAGYAEAASALLKAVNDSAKADIFVTENVKLPKASKNYDIIQQIFS